MKDVQLRDAPSDKRPPVLVIGIGRWGINLASTLFRLGALAGIVDSDSKRLAVVAPSFPGVLTFGSIGKAIETGATAVAIATPAETHHAVALAMLSAGKDVFVEKPLTLLDSDALELTNMAKQRGRILMVGHMLLYQPAIQFLKRFLDEGSLGKPYSIHQVRRNLGTVRRHENVLFSFGVHDVAVLDLLTGRSPERILAVGQCCLYPNIEDEVNVNLWFGNNLRAQLDLSWLWPVKQRCLTITCEGGFLVYDELTHEVVAHKSFINRSGQIERHGSTVLFEGSAEPLELEMMHFLDCIETRSTPITGAAHAVNVVRMTNRIKEALESR